MNRPQIFDIYNKIEFEPITEKQFSHASAVGNWLVREAIGIFH